MKKLIFHITSLLLFSITGAQNLKYEIIRGESKIGYLDVIYTKNGDKETYSIKNVVEFKVLFTFSVEYALSESFKNGVLISGKGYNTMNGHTEKETSLETTPGGYHLLIDGILANPEKKPITASVSQIYHHEPTDKKALYSQYFGRYLYAEKIAEHKYSVVSPDGENIYSYENGFCREVQVTRDFATIFLRMSPESLAMIKKVR